MSRVATVVTLRPATRTPEVRDLTEYRVERHRSLVTEARDLMMEGEEAAALQRCYEALRVKRDSYEALSLSGTLLAMLGDAETSVTYTREAIRLQPDRADAYYDLASTLLDLGRAGEALEWLEAGTARLGERKDDLVDFMYSARVEALAELGRFDEAEALLAEARGRCADALQLLVSAREHLENLRTRPRLRLI